MANRHERRAKGVFDRKMGSLLRRITIDTALRTLTIVNDRDENGSISTCDVPGCTNEWMFAHHATDNRTKERKLVARRCSAHRIGESKKEPEVLF